MRSVYGSAAGTWDRPTRTVQMRLFKAAAAVSPGLPMPAGFAEG